MYKILAFLFCAVTALFQLDDGTIRKMVLLRETPQMSPVQIAVSLGIVVASILSCIGCCCCYANRDKILKRNSAPPAAVVVAVPTDAGMSPTQQPYPQQPPPPPVAQVGHSPNVFLNRRPIGDDDL